jgi:predicted TIM-barrel fold metal-dependent hydrolase
MKWQLTWPVLILLTGCAAPLSRDIAAREAVAPAAAVPLELVESERLSPLVDHHQHLLSPAAAELETKPLMPAVEVPPQIAQLLKRRAELSSNAAELAGLFSEDVLLHGFGESGWIRGADKAAQFISSNFSPGYRLTPVSYKSRGQVVEIAGYYTRGEGDTVRHVGYFSMNLVKAPDGGWRIAAETPVFPGPQILRPVDGQALVEMLDAAGMKRALVLSNAYWFDGLIEHSGDPYALMRAENDWTAEQVRRFPDRLTAFCSFNPLSDYALSELDRCSSKLEFVGVKLHLGTSGVDLLDIQHVEKLRQIVEAANRSKMPILVHLVASRDYGQAHAEAFLEKILPAAPDVAVVIAHLWGGAGYSDEALAVYANAVSAGNPSTANLYFDVAQVSMVEGDNEENLRKMVARIRQIGLDRILYGSDGTLPPGMPPRLVWADFQVKMPLSQSELRKIAANVAPFMR